MQFILTPEQIRLADTRAINELNIPSIVLMENAARSAAEIIWELLRSQKPEIRNQKRRVLFLCGSGNNGGDGFATARQLVSKIDSFGPPFDSVDVFWIGDTKRMSAETLSNFTAVEKIGIPLEHLENEDDLTLINDNYICIVDALLGVGGSEKLKGIVEPLLTRINSFNCLKIAIDIPTGLNSQTGFASENAFRADYTVTMYAIKTGMLLNKGLDLCGNIRVANLGAPQNTIQELSGIFVLEDSDARNILKPRHRRTSKFDYGKAVIVAGSKNLSGAAALCSNAAITAGAGLVYLFTPKIHSATLPEVIATEVTPNDYGTISIKSLDAVMKYIEKSNAVAIGPGLGDNEEVKEFISSLLMHAPEHIPIVIDADGLKAVNRNTSLRRNILLTPHTGEFSQITQIPRSEVELHSLEHSRNLAQELNCLVLIKHVPVIITDGDETYFNIGGNPGMATAGSGDVLTGIIAGLLAQRVEPIKAAALGAYIHSTSGDYFTRQHSPETLTASDLISSMKFVL